MCYCNNMQCTAALSDIHTHASVSNSSPSFLNTRMLLLSMSSIHSLYLCSMNIANLLFRFSEQLGQSWNNTAPNVRGMYNHCHTLCIFTNKQVIYICVITAPNVKRMYCSKTHTYTTCNNTAPNVRRIY